MLTEIEIKNRLQFLQPSFIEITDDSRHHAEHIENPTGGLTHATITIVSDKFDNLPLIARHKMIYGALTDALQGSLHALSLKTFTSKEFTSI